MRSMHLVVAGSSGFLGSHLVNRLRERGHEITRLVRREPTTPDESRWQPDTGMIDAGVVATADVVINVAGSSTVGNPHSGAWARRLRQSRVDTTRLLAETIGTTGGRAAFLAGNGISYYGDHGDDVVTEESGSRGAALLTSVCQDWQAATGPAAVAGARVCVLRTAPVMDRRSAPLKQLRLLFRLGLGARLGDGRQYMPMISLRDWVGAVVHLAEHEDASGPVNLVCPQPPTNREFTEVLARALGRPTLLVAPSAAISLASGRMGPELLGSMNARPGVLLARGYEFSDPDVSAVVAAGLG